MGLAGKAESLDAVVALEARLSEIRYELESYTSQLRLYDNQVDYSTVSIYMREVKDLTPTAPDSIGTRIQKGFNRSLNNLGEAVTDLIVWLAVNSPILFVLAVIIGAVVLIVRRLSRKLRGGNDPQGVSLHSAASPWEERRAQRTRRSRRRKDSRRKNRRRGNRRRKNRIKIKTNMEGRTHSRQKQACVLPFYGVYS